MKETVLKTACVLSAILFIACISCLRASQDEENYGIAREAVLKSVNPDCMVGVLRKMHEITKVDAPKPSVGSKQIANLIYEGKGFTVNLSVGQREDGLVNFSQQSVSIYKKPSKEELRLTREVMIKVEANLVKECGLNELATGVKEECYGMECPK